MKRGCFGAEFATWCGQFLFNLPLGCALSIICIHKSCLLQCRVVFIKKRHIIDCERNLNYINVCDLAVASCATKWRGYEFETALKYGLCTWMNFKFYFFGGETWIRHIRVCIFEGILFSFTIPPSLRYEYMQRL